MPASHSTRLVHVTVPSSYAAQVHDTLKSRAHAFGLTVFGPLDRSGAGGSCTIKKRTKMVEEFNDAHSPLFAFLRRALSESSPSSAHDCRWTGLGVPGDKLTWQAPQLLT